MRVKSQINLGGIEYEDNQDNKKIKTRRKIKKQIEISNKSRRNRI